MSVMRGNDRHDGGMKADMDDLYGCYVPRVGPSIREDLDLISDAISDARARRTPIPAAGRQWIAKRAVAALQDDDQPLVAHAMAASMLNNLDRISLKADEFLLKAKLVEQVGPQSWSAWLAEDPADDVTPQTTSSR